jgi:DinB family protein
MDVYLERGKKRVFAGALAWPGWSRSGTGEEAALEALAAYAPRYAAAIEGAHAGFKAPEITSLEVVERLEGNATTDFGAPGRIPEADVEAVDDAELKRLEGIMRAVWRSFDQGVETARGAALRGGPRGGGRSLAKVIGHVCEGEHGYLHMLGGSYKSTAEDPVVQLAGMHDAFLEALAQRARGEIADRGPRGGVRWPVRYAARRAAWHVLDHLWEIEDRSTGM